MSDRALLYIADPMCSWCWGLAPSLSALSERAGLPLELKLGGLAAGPNAPVLDDAMAERLTGRWVAVAKATGQPFNLEVLKRRGWLYDTELSCCAALAVREQAPSLAFAFLERLQRAFYVDAVDVTDLKAYPALLEGFVPDPQATAASLVAPPLLRRVWSEFSWTRRLGVFSYPALFLRTGARYALLSQGWAPLDELHARVSGQAAAPRAPALEVCEIGLGR